MLTVPCYLAPSAIEGLGIFCLRDIRKGEVIWLPDMLLDLRVPKARLDHYPPHVREFIERYAYVDRQAPELLILESDEGKFMNHSHAPNTDFTAPDVGIATVDIPAGTEITCNYGDFELGEVVMQPPRHRVHGQAA